MRFVPRICHVLTDPEVGLNSTGLKSEFEEGSCWSTKALLITHQISNFSPAELDLILNSEFEEGSCWSAESVWVTPGSKFESSGIGLNSAELNSELGEGGCLVN
jgi:hypothetical protein